MSDKLLFLIMYCGGGLVFSAISLPLLFRKIPPNNWYGFRVQATLQDPKVWYAANEYMARRLLFVGIITAAAALVGYFVPNLGVTPYFVGCTLVMLVSLFANLVQGMNFLRKR